MIPAIIAMGAALPLYLSYLKRRAMLCWTSDWELVADTAECARTYSLNWEEWRNEK